MRLSPLPNNCHQQSGIALTIAIIFILAVVSMIGVTMNQIYDFKVATAPLIKSRIMSYYNAQSGVVDAQWRIRTNTITGWTVPAGKDFTDPTWNPPIYYLDIDTNPPTFSTSQQATSDVSVDIGLPDPDGIRGITLVGFDT